MPSLANIRDSIRRLCDLESNRGPLASVLSNLERRFEIGRLRSIVPPSLLAHHDRVMQTGRPSIVSVSYGLCSACGEPLPAARFARLRNSPDLEVCDKCGTFLYFEPTSKRGLSTDSQDKGAKGRSEKRRCAVKGNSLP